MIHTTFKKLRRLLGRHTGMLGLHERLERQRELLEEIRQAQTRMVEQRERSRTLEDALRPFAGMAMPVYLDEALRPMASPQRGISPHRVVVCSIPKAGTYLVGRLLELLGLTPTMLHVWLDGLSDYRNKSIEQMRRDYLKFNVALPLQQSLKLVHQGQFTVGHLECNDVTKALLTPFKKIFVYRNLRDAAISLMRFCMDTGRAAGASESWKELPEGAERMRGFLDALGAQFLAACHTGWLTDPQVFCVSFEQLYGDEGSQRQQEIIGRLHRHLEIPTPAPDPAHVVSRLIGRPTLTWSGSRTKREDYWNEAVEEKFQQLGGGTLNANLGYDESAKSGLRREAA